VRGPGRLAEGLSALVAWWSERRDLLIVLGLFALLIASGAASYLSRPGESGQGSPYSTYSAGPAGALALYRWLDALGYRVRRVTSVPFAVPGDARLLIVLGPSDGYSAPEAEAVTAWVRQGGAAVLGLDAADPALLRAVGGEVRPLPLPAGGDPRQAQPLLQRPPPRRLLVSHAVGVAFADPRAVSYLTVRAGSQRATVLRERPLGAGSVYLLGAPQLLSNAGITQADNRLLALNLLADVGPGAVVAFDEYHHGVRVRDAQEVADLLFTTPLGRSLLYAGIVALVYLWLGGRRLGRPVMPPTPAARSVAEYIVSLGGLFRRGGARGDALDILRRAFHRDVAAALGLDPPTGEHADGAALTRALEERSLLSVAGILELRALLVPVDNTTLSEAELVRRARALDRIHAEVRQAVGQRPGDSGTGIHT